MDSTSVKVFIADDAAIMRQRLATVVGEINNAKIVGQAETAEQTIKEVRRLKPDVVILDVRMPGSGLTALRDIKKFSPPPFVIIVTAFPYPQVRQRCLALGADLFLDKTSAEFEQLPQIIKQRGANAQKDQVKK